MFELKITAGSPAELVSIIAALQPKTVRNPRTEVGGPDHRETKEITSEPRETAPPKPEKAEKEITPEEPVEEPEPEPEGAKSNVEYADVQKAVTRLAAAKGRDAVFAVFDQFSVIHAKELDAAQWPEALAALTDARDAE